MQALNRKITLVCGALIVMLGLFLSFSPDASAQTKRKPRKRTKRAAVTPTPVPQPVVVSRAEEFQNQNQQIITGGNQLVTIPETDPLAEPQTQTQPETFDEKLDRISRRLDEMNSGDSKKKNAYDEKQKRLALNLDILTKAEQRSESLRKQLYEMVEKENNLKTRLETIDYDLRPEMIDRQIAFAGSLRPEELREMRRKNLDAEKRNLQNLLIEIQTARTNLELNVQKADQLVEKLRFKLEKDIDEALNDEQKP
jgi:hypothetical protein